MDREAVARLQALRRFLKDSLEVAARVIEEANRLIDNLNVNRSAAPPAVILGDIVYDGRAQAALCSVKCDLILQGALDVDRGGIGVVLWSPEDWDRFQQDRASGATCGEIRFAQFESCPPEIQIVLLPFVGTLIDRLIENAGGEG